METSFYRGKGRDKLNHNNNGFGLITWKLPWNGGKLLPIQGDSKPNHPHLTWSQLVNELDRTFGGLISSKLFPKWLARLRLWDRALMARPFNRIFPIGAGITQGTSANAKRAFLRAMSRRCLKGI